MAIELSETALSTHRRGSRLARVKPAHDVRALVGGISHHLTANTKDADIVLGCQVFADAASKT
jgi:hypothetical protein